MSYLVEQEAYQGPLDLLLDLVSRQRLDVTEVSISTITEEYLDAVRSLEELDLNSASSFLILAATLLELKSLKLLPVDAADDGLALLLEERDHLIHRLIEYSTFRSAAAVIDKALEANAQFFVRTAPFPTELFPSSGNELTGLTAKKLAKAAAGALFEKPADLIDTSHVSPLKVSVREMVDVLADQIKKTGTSTFRSLCKDHSARIQVIVRFLALLELFKDQSVDLEQERPFDEILISWRTGAQEGEN